MNKHLVTIITAMLLALPNAGFAQKKIQSHPAYLPLDTLLDLQSTKPEVNVNLPKFLLKEAAEGLDSDPNNGLSDMGIELSTLIKDIDLIRVLVISSSEARKPNVVEGIKKLRTQLNTDWTSIISVPDGGVGIYAKTNDTGESMEGISALISDGDDAVIINIVGRVPLGKIIQLAGSMNKLPKDFLKNLGGFTGVFQDELAADPATDEPAQN
ncbi:DUF4252 domain-containing protein [bacterium]|nr:DUF4252 domain-containing protein [bacterium]